MDPSLIHLTREHLDKTAALDPLAPSEQEASLELWDSPDPREPL